MLLVVLPSILSDGKTYYYTTNWYYKDNPVTSVRALNYVCEDEGCYTLGEKISDEISHSNSITVVYPLPSSEHGYATYWFSPCFIGQEMTLKPLRSESWNYDVSFTRSNNCTADILNFSINYSEFGNGPVVIASTIKSAFEEVDLPPFSEPDDQDIIKDFLSAQTKVILIIKKDTRIIYNKTKEEYILWSSLKNISFNWTPTEAGIYTIYLNTTVPDCKCNNQISQQEQKTIIVCLDKDGDGFYVNNSECGIIDCDDSNSNVYPGANETCNSIDDDCDGWVDEELTRPCGIGPCQGMQTCTEGQWSNCSSQGSDAGICAICNVDGIPVYDETQDNDCDIYDISEIATCFYDPDGVNTTYDYFSGFNSECYDTYTCTTAPTNWKDHITHTCDKDCGAECETDLDCKATECDNLDGCYDGTYRDYSDMANICLEEDCACTQNTCTVYSEITTDNDNDGYDIECDNDCDDNNPAVNPGAQEICDGIDNNCNQQIDEGFTNENCQYVCENNGYVWTNNGGNLNCCGNDNLEDGPYEINEVSCEDGRDNDCDGLIDLDDIDCQNWVRYPLYKGSQGYNMFSLPVIPYHPVTFNDINDGCEVGGNMLAYWNPEKDEVGGYEYITTDDILQPGQAYFIRVRNDCAFVVAGDNFRFSDGIVGYLGSGHLKAGWNMIGSDSFGSIHPHFKGNCNIVSGPWKVDPAANRYVRTNHVEPGLGYWIKVTDDCQLG